ncbi:NADH-quinone oxidoreductase subunit E [Desulforhabdus amnigena]|uniref:NADH-quinone oxidoreductase subunit E n=2 Tax=Desulforhabdus amnigena TaxID=40218 RepID=A0A9W6FWZ6_9BACT|nr:NADH-quinone oxidoreductase subunit E [Desulforhabdus amnigena]
MGNRKEPGSLFFFEPDLYQTLRDSITMLPIEMKKKIVDKIAHAESPREQAIDVMTEMQNYYGYMSDEAMVEAGELLGMTPLELEELATFYNFIYRQPVGKYVIHICDSTVCWMNGYESLLDYLCSLLNVELGGTSSDGLFTLLPVCCLGYCDHAPAMIINREIYGELTPEKIERIIGKLRDRAYSAEKGIGE